MTIQVFEHNRLTVGTDHFQQRHFDALARLAPSKYFQLQHRAVRFKQYVGAIQVQDLTIEILPKIDQQEQDAFLWRNVLLDMLRYCRLLKLESLGDARLSVKQHSILELYYELFLKEVIQILHRGVYKSYHNKVANRKSLKGQLQFAPHIQHNLVHKERFYTRQQVYTTDNLFNQIIFKALDLLLVMPLPPHLQLLTQSLYQQFPKHIATHFPFDQLVYNRQNEHYRDAIKIAQLLIQQNQPSLRSGQRSLLALLFDMNLLFEEYVYRQLSRVRHSDLRVMRQQQKPFWNQQRIRPDIVMQFNHQRFVIDTKWKMLKQSKPSMSDLQQAFVYSQYFDAPTSILLYPQNGERDAIQPTAFHIDNGRKCGVFFAEIIKDNQLNQQLGSDFLNYLQ